MNFNKVIITSCFIVLCLAGCKKSSEKGSMPQPPEVDISIPLKHNITEWDEYAGRFEATQHVDIRARVTGYLIEKKFTDGQIVHKGDVLFVIDPRPFIYQMERANAQYQLARKEYKRAKSLRKTQAISQEDFDRREQEFKVEQAGMNDSKLDIEFTKIIAPIDGRISESFIDVGNLVRENDTVLTRLVSIAPIHFVFEASQTQFLKYIRLDPAGFSVKENSAPVLIKLQDEDSYMHKGRMDFADNIVDMQTGSIQLRALIENENGVLYPGLFGKARINKSGNYEAILLPENAINTDQDRKFVYVLDNENKAQRFYVTTGAILDNGFIVIQQGLTGQERVVVNGIQRIRKSSQSVTPAQIKLEWTEQSSMPDLRAIPTLAEIIGRNGVEQVGFASGQKILKSE